MKALINGGTDLIKLFKGTERVLNVLIMNNDGSTLTAASGTIDLIVYDRSDRLSAAVATHSGDAALVAAAGSVAVTIPESELSYGPGDYYMFVRLTDAATKIFWSAPFNLNIA